jgi:anaerobic magnesium-protoporphyrin IX monomethyl ester cyclase
MAAPLSPNRGIRTPQVLTRSPAPLADSAVLQTYDAGGDKGRTDLLLVNPPAPDGGIWIRSQHRVGRRSREGMIWPQVSLAQMAALFPDRDLAVVDAIPHRMTWDAFIQILEERRPRYYVTQVTAPTLDNDMFGVFRAKALGAVTIAFGTHVTPLPEATMRAFPALDYVLRGEPELTLRELVDTLERRRSPTAGLAASEADWWPNVDADLSARLRRMYTGSDTHWQPAWMGGSSLEDQLARVKGLVWRGEGHLIVNAERPLITNLDDLPLPRHDLLPLDRYRAPLVGGPYTFVVTSRGCPGRCRFCIKHVSYGDSVRFRSPSNVLAEIDQVTHLGVRDVHMYADLFTINRDHVMGICQGLLERDRPIRWTCNSRVDYCDAEMLRSMAQAGCWMISWGIESGDEAMLRRMRKGTTLDAIERALTWSREAGIRNWGYFIIGLPGETTDSIRRTIDLAKRLPLDLALFHIAAPHPGTPLFFEVVENGWFRPGTKWEAVDMDRSTVLDYPNLSAEELVWWTRRAFREWALRPGPMWTYLKMLMASPSLIRSALEIGLESLGWARG